MKKSISLLLIILVLITNLMIHLPVKAQPLLLVTEDVSFDTVDVKSIDNQLEKVILNDKVIYSYYQDTSNGNIVLIFDEDKNLIQKAVADKEKNIVTETVYSTNQKSVSIDETKKIYNMSSMIVKDIEENQQSEESLHTDENNIISKATIPGYNYLNNEPLFNNGLTQWSDGYYYIGSSKSSTLPYTAYLFRQQTTWNSSAKTYNFSKGTTLATIVSTVGVILTGITTASVSFLVGSVLVGGVVDYFFSADMGVKNIHNLYRSRVGNSYTLRYSCCKRMNYWYSKIWDKNINDYKDTYNYKNWEHGYPSSIDRINVEGINCESQGIVIQRPCI